MRINKLINYVGITVIFLFFIDYEAISQVKERYIPKSFNEKNLVSISNLPFIKMPSFDITAMINEDSLNKRYTKPLRIAKGFNVTFSTSNSGIWDTLTNGDKIWRLRIKSPGAHLINIFFKEFDIPLGAQVFIYNKDTTKLIGAFTSKNNSESKVLSTSPVEGDEIIVEYDVPKDIATSGKLTIGNIGHWYKSISKSNTFQDGNYQSSLSCEVDINCSDGANWQNEKVAVARILFSDGSDWYLCTGS